MNSPKVQSIRARLLKLSRERKVDFNHILTRYGIERMLYRISESPHTDRFVLKGAMLFTLWMGYEHRPTKDLDLLGLGRVDEESLREMFSDICTLDVEDDGVVFDPASIRIEEIREAEVYQGLRIRLRGTLGSARIIVSVDVGAGDVIVPPPKKAKYPVLLDLPSPQIKTYPPETVVAEKLDAIILLGLRNSRMKDYFDLWTLASNFEFDASMLIKAIKATLERRGRTLPADIPIGLRAEFTEDKTKQVQWKAYINRIAQNSPHLPLDEVVERIRRFLEPILYSITTGQEFNQHWRVESGWVHDELDDMQ